jgi:hypothetical protein
MQCLRKLGKTTLGGNRSNDEKLRFHERYPVMDESQPFNLTCDRRM